MSGKVGHSSRTGQGQSATGLPQGGDNQNEQTLNTAVKPISYQVKPHFGTNDSFLADPKIIAMKNRMDSFGIPPPKKDGTQKVPEDTEEKPYGTHRVSLAESPKGSFVGGPNEADAQSPIGRASLFTSALDDPRRRMSGAYSQLTMEERVRALSLLKKHGLFPLALKLQKAPKPSHGESVAPQTQQVLDETAIFEVVKAAVEDVPETTLYGRKMPPIEVPFGAVGAVGTSGIKPPVPTPEESDAEKEMKKFLPPGTVEPKGAVPICDELRPCVRREPCQVKEQPKDLTKELSPSQMEAHHYLSKKKIFEFFQFMICHLLSDQPVDPVAFLGNLLDRCMMFRSGFCEAPLLFTDKHVASMYRALDPGEIGYISMRQYETGMKTMGVSNYTTDPVTDENGNINKEFFVKEAVRCLTNDLMEMLKVGEVEPWKYLDKWRIPTAKVMDEDVGQRRSGSGSMLPPPAPPPSSRMTPGSIARASFAKGSASLAKGSSSHPGPWVPPQGSKPGTVVEMAPARKPSKPRGSVIGNPSAAESLRRDSERYQSTMHEGPHRD